MDTLYQELETFLCEESIAYMQERYKTPRELLALTEHELITIPKIGKKRALQLKSIFNISQEIIKPQIYDSPTISSPQDVADHCQYMNLLEEEHFVLLLLNTKNRITHTFTLTKGTLNVTVIHPRDVFATAIKHKANAIIAVHNHPSGDPTPSPEDISMTHRLSETGKVVGIELLDHIVIANGSHHSMREWSQLEKE